MMAVRLPDLSTPETPLRMKRSPRFPPRGTAYSTSLNVSVAGSMLGGGGGAGAGSPVWTASLTELSAQMIFGALPPLWQLVVQLPQRRVRAGQLRAQRRVDAAERVLQVGAGRGARRVLR